jgi:hypothetical protein
MVREKLWPPTGSSRLPRRRRRRCRQCLTVDAQPTAHRSATGKRGDAAWSVYTTPTKVDRSALYRSRRTASVFKPSPIVDVEK